MILTIKNNLSLISVDTDYFEGMKRVLRMQHGDHDLVDPYMIVSFAGKKLKTKVLYKTYTPEWAQELNIGVQMPSMCEQLMLRLMDKLVLTFQVLSFRLSVRACLDSVYKFNSPIL